MHIIPASVQVPECTPNRPRNKTEKTNTHTNPSTKKKVITLGLKKPNLMAEDWNEKNEIEKEKKRKNPQTPLEKKKKEKNGTWYRAFQIKLTTKLKQQN